MRDVLFHVAIAVAATLLSLLTPCGWDQWPLAFAGSVIWVGREAWQNRGKWGNWFRRWSRQKKAEAIAPAAAGLFAALAVTLA